MARAGVAMVASATPAAATAAVVKEVATRWQSGRSASICGAKRLACTLRDIAAARLGR